MRTCFYRNWTDIIADYKIESLDEFKEHMRIGMEEAFVHAVPFAGAVQFLDECRARQAKLGIVTSTTRPFVDRFIESHGLHGYFQAIVTASDVANHKPHPEPVLLALSLLGARPEDSLIIGDSSVDLLAGHAAGIERGLFFPHEHGLFYDYQELSGHEPHFVFHDYKELHERLRKIGTE